MKTASDKLREQLSRLDDPALRDICLNHDVLIWIRKYSNRPPELVHIKKLLSLGKPLTELHDHMIESILRTEHHDPAVFDSILREAGIPSDKQIEISRSQRNYWLTVSGIVLAVLGLLWAVISWALP